MPHAIVESPPQAIATPSGGWQKATFFLAGALLSVSGMLVRSDFVGTRAAERVEARLASEIVESESRVNARMDREIVAVRRELQEIKEAVVRIADR